MPKVINIEQGHLEQVEEEDIDFDNEIVAQLNDLHSHEKLTSPNIKLNDIPILHTKITRRTFRIGIERNARYCPFK